MTFKRWAVTEGGAHLLIQVNDNPHFIRSLDFRKIFTGNSFSDCLDKFERFADLQMKVGKITYTVLAKDSAQPQPFDPKIIESNLNRLYKHNENKSIIDKWSVGKVDLFESDYQNCIIHLPSGEICEAGQRAKRFWKYKAYRLFRPILTFIPRIWKYECDEVTCSVTEKDSTEQFIEWRIESSMIKSRSVGSMLKAFGTIAKAIQNKHGPINQVLLQNLESFQGRQQPTTYYL